MSDWFAFARIPAPTGPPAFRLTAQLVRAAAWTTLAWSVLTVLFIAGVFVTIQPGQIGSDPTLWRSLILISIVASLIVPGFMVWWAGKVYRNWVERRPKADGQMIAYAVVLIVVAAITMLQNQSFRTTSSGPSNSFVAWNYSGALPGAAILVLGILILVQRGKPESQIALQTPAKA